MHHDDSLSHDRSYFVGLYERDDDPWGFDRAFYERRKYDMTLAALPDPSYRRAVEPGCANGALTERLARRCSSMVAFDMIEPAVVRARQRLRHQPGVDVRVESFPDYWPDGTVDLVVWSEIAYYLTDSGVAVALDRLDRHLETDGVLVAAHYTGETDYPRSGSSIGPWLDSIEFLHRITSIEDEQFDLGVWRRT